MIRECMKDHEMSGQRKEPDERIRQARKLVESLEAQTSSRKAPFVGIRPSYHGSSEISFGLAGLGYVGRLVSVPCLPTQPKERTQ